MKGSTRKESGKKGSGKKTKASIKKASTNKSFEGADASDFKIVTRKQQTRPNTATPGFATFCTIFNSTPQIRPSKKVKKSFLQEDKGANFHSFCVRFSPDSSVVASAHGDGAVRILDHSARQSAICMVDPAGLINLPATTLAFRPHPGNEKQGSKVILVGNAEGNLTQYIWNEQEVIDTAVEGTRAILALSYHPEGTYFATGSQDCTVRVYDEQTKHLVTSWGAVDQVYSRPGHTNQVFAVKYWGKDPNILISGGWDFTVKVWDVRAPKYVKSLYGPYLAGEALDINVKGHIITGSHQQTNQLQMWDMNSGKLMYNIPMGENPKDDGPSSMLYGACFGQQSNCVVACGKFPDQVRMFDLNQKEMKRYVIAEKVKVKQAAAKQAKLEKLKSEAVEKGIDPDTIFLKEEPKDDDEEKKEAEPKKDSDPIMESLHYVIAHHKFHGTAYTCDISPDEGWLAVGGAHDTVQVINLANL